MIQVMILLRVERGINNDGCTPADLLGIVWPGMERFAEQSRKRGRLVGVFDPPVAGTGLVYSHRHCCGAAPAFGGSPRYIDAKSSPPALYWYVIPGSGYKSLAFEVRLPQGLHVAARGGEGDPHFIHER